MAFCINLKIFFALYVLCSCLYSHGQGQDINIDVFKNLSEINQEWLQFTSIPEVARLLQLPPYSYHSSKSVSGGLSPSKLDVDIGSSILEVIDKEDGKCSDDFIQIFSNLDSSWALQILDSYGKLRSGILRGGLIWPGHYSECISAYSPKDKNGHGDFYGKYCVSSWSLNLTSKQYSNLPLTIGLCVPDSCSGENIKISLKNISSHILDRVPILKKLESHLTLKSIVCKAKERSVDAAGIIYLCIVSVFIILTVLGSSIAVFDYWKFQHVAKRNILTTQSQDYGSLRNPEHSINNHADSEKPLSNTSAKEVEAEVVCFNPNTDAELQSVISSSNQPVPVVKRILLCFSVFSNGQKIMNTQNVDGQLLSIHGIRFLSLTWVILGHTYISSVSMIGNRLDVLNDMDTFAFQMLLQSPFSVDSFFLLSGFLLTYLFLKDATKKNGNVNWVKFYLHRIWRLTPSYIIAVFFYMLIFKYLGSGPFWNDDNCDASRHTWWKYFLYINNFIPIHDMCVGWSWYLANDMQFYVISPLFLYPLWKWPAAGFAILGSILVATWTTTGVMSYSYDLIPMFVGVTHTSDFTAYETRMWDSFDLIYDKPYCRIAPYIIGVVLGYILHKTADKKNFLNWWQQVLGWTIASFCSLSVVFGLYHVEMSRTVSLFYNALCRSSFSIGLAWLIYVCETGHGGFLTKFLSWKLWIPLSRLTYSAYLIHPMLIHGYYQAYQTALFFTEYVAVTNFLGFLIMSYVLAFMFSLVFESPFMNLEKVILKKKAQ